ncbi:MAG TPA: twin-arginine translocase TatA/TatE family subunit [Chloroflexota bacterium]
MGALQPLHLIVVLVIVLIIFGPGKLPQLGKALGDGIRELKRATDDEPVAPALAIWTCTQCHTAVPTTDRFCGTCGAVRDQSSRAAASNAAH